MPLSGDGKSRCQRIWKNLKTTTQVALRIKSNNVGQDRQMSTDNDDDDRGERRREQRSEITMMTTNERAGSTTTCANEHTDEMVNCSAYLEKINKIRGFMNKI